MAITINAPRCECEVHLKTRPSTKGKIVPPNNPIIINPETSFFLSGIYCIACESITGNMFELPNPTNAIEMYISVKLLNVKKSDDR